LNISENIAEKNKKSPLIFFTTEILLNPCISSDFMEVKDVKANQGKIDLVVEVVNKQEPRSFEKFGKKGKVCNATVKDDSGEIVLTLWNDDVDKVNIGDKVRVQNGWCSEFKGEKQLSAGKFGKIEVVQSNKVYTNDPGILGGAAGVAAGLGGEESEESGEEPMDAEEFVE